MKRVSLLTHEFDCTDSASKDRRNPTGAGTDALSDGFRSRAEAATGARDAKMLVVTETLRSARDVLMGLNRDNPDALGDFRFKVSDTRSAKASPEKPGV